MSPGFLEINANLSVPTGGSKRDEATQRREKSVLPLIVQSMSFADPLYAIELPFTHLLQNG